MKLEKSEQGHHSLTFELPDASVKIVFHPNKMVIWSEGEDEETVEDESLGIYVTHLFKFKNCYPIPKSIVQCVDKEFREYNDGDRIVKITLTIPEMKHEFVFDDEVVADKAFWILETWVEGEYSLDNHLNEVE